jgi:hypothetical protein
LSFSKTQISNCGRKNNIESQIVSKPRFEKISVCLVTPHLNNPPL